MGIDVWTEKPLRLVSRIKKELKRIFPFPSRFFRIVDGFGGASSLNIHGFDTAGGARPTDLASFTPLPGPWGFLTSGYIVGLVIMVLSVVSRLDLELMHGYRQSCCTGSKTL